MDEPTRLYLSTDQDIFTQLAASRLFSVIFRRSLHLLRINFLCFEVSRGKYSPVYSFVSLCIFLKDKLLSVLSNQLQLITRVSIDIVCTSDCFSCCAL